MYDECFWQKNTRSSLKDFCDVINIVKKPLTWKIQKNPCCINLIFILTTLSAIRKSFQKYKPRMLQFWDYIYFQNNAFIGNLLSEILNFNIEIKDKTFIEFFETCSKYWNYYTTLQP